MCEPETSVVGRVEAGEEVLSEMEHMVRTVSLATWPTKEVAGDHIRVS